MSIDIKNHCQSIVVQGLPSLLSTEFTTESNVIFSNHVYEVKGNLTKLFSGLVSQSFDLFYLNGDNDVDLFLQFSNQIQDDEVSVAAESIVTIRNSLFETAFQLGIGDRLCLFLAVVVNYERTGVGGYVSKLHYDTKVPCVDFGRLLVPLNAPVTRGVLNEDIVDLSAPIPVAKSNSDRFYFSVGEPIRMAVYKEGCVLPTHPLAHEAPPQEDGFEDGVLKYEKPRGFLAGGLNLF